MADAAARGALSASMPDLYAVDADSAYGRTDADAGADSAYGRTDAADADSAGAAGGRSKAVTRESGGESGGESDGGDAEATLGALWMRQIRLNAPTQEQIEGIYRHVFGALQHNHHGVVPVHWIEECDLAPCAEVGDEPRRCLYCAEGQRRYARERHVVDGSTTSYIVQWLAAQFLDADIVYEDVQAADGGGVGSVLRFSFRRPKRAAPMLIVARSTAPCAPRARSRSRSRSPTKAGAESAGAGAGADERPLGMLWRDACRLRNAPSAETRASVRRHVLDALAQRKVGPLPVLRISASDIHACRALSAERDSEALAALYGVGADEVAGDADADGASMLHAACEFCWQHARLYGKVHVVPYSTLHLLIEWLDGDGLEVAVEYAHEYSREARDGAESAYLLYVRMKRLKRCARARSLAASLQRPAYW